MTTAQASLLSPAEVESAQASARSVLEGLDRTLIGQSALTRSVLVGCLARGHVLLEGLPGLGKTELVKGLAALVGLRFRRLQFTPDLMPGDITGGHVLEQDSRGERRFVFHEGPVFTNVLLADEINRASPKTQSALLEAMAERRVTVLGETRALPSPFFVLATQNPIELEGTYPLPEAQLDRFLFKVEVPPVSSETLETILNTRRAGRPPEHSAVLDEQRLASIYSAVERVHLAPAVASTIARLVAATHPGASGAPDKVKQYVRHGASPRGAIAIGEAARAHALLAGKPAVGFQDVHAVALPALAHRLVLDYRARLDGVRGADLVRAVLASLPETAELG